MQFGETSHRLRHAARTAAGVTGRQNEGMGEAGGGIRVVPANEASWDDVAAIFGRRGPASRCFCQRFKLAHRESFGVGPVRGPGPPVTRADRMRTARRRDHQRTDRLPRRRAGRLVRGRAATPLRRPGPRLPGAVGGPRRGQVRRLGLGRDLPPHPGRFPQARRRPRPGPRHRRLRSRPRRPRHRGLPDHRRMSCPKNSTSAPRACSPTPATPIVSRPGTRRLVMRIDF